MITVTATQITLAQSMIVRLRAQSKTPNRLTVLVANAQPGQKVQA